MNKQITVGVITIGVIVMIVVGTTTMTIFPAASISMPTLQKTALGGFGGGVDDRKAPIATSEDNIYIAWWNNKTGDDETMFRASTDGGATFADKINLSNTTGSESVDTEIAAEGDNVIVTWWERNATSNEPIARISTDNGATFGPLLKLATNGTIGEGPS
jgi:hypothetical protein